MMWQKMGTITQCVACIAFVLGGTWALPAPASEGTRVLLIVLDGLRPDYVNPNLMPNLHAWSREGVVFEKHHATFPTVTRVNASSIVTGTYPDRHGIVDNSVYFPAVDPDHTLSTGSRGALEKIMAAENGHLQTAENLGELLAEHGMKTVAFSAGSSGSAFLLNYSVRNGAIINTGYVLPETLAPAVLERIGDEPPESAPNDAQNRRIVRAYLEYGLSELDPALSILWISDPDHTAHEYGMGTATTTRALRLVDDCVGYILDTLKGSGRLAATNVG